MINNSTALTSPKQEVIAHSANNQRNRSQKYQPNG